MSSQSKKDILIKILKFAVAFGLIGVMVSQGLIDFSVLAKMADPLNLAIALILVFVNLYVQNWRWTVILKAREFDVSMKETFPLTLIGVFFNFALPGAIGGDVVKAYYIAQDNSTRRVEAVTTVLIDRVLGLYGMILLALLAMLFNLQFVVANSSLLAVFYSSFFLFLGMTVFIGLSLSKTLRKALHLDLVFSKLPGGQFFSKLYDALNMYRKHLGMMVYTIVLSLLAQVVAVIFMLFIGGLIGDEGLNWATYFFAVPIGFIVSSLPIAPAGLGVGQYAFLVLFELYSGAKTNVGQTAITAFQVFLFAWGMIGGYFYLKKKQPKQLEEAMS